MDTKPSSSLHPSATFLFVGTTALRSVRPSVRPSFVLGASGKSPISRTRWRKTEDGHGSRVCALDFEVKLADSPHIIARKLQIRDGAASKWTRGSWRLGWRRRRHQENNHAGREDSVTAAATAAAAVQKIHSAEE